MSEDHINSALLASSSGNLCSVVASVQFLYYNMKKAKVLCTFFVTVFIHKTCLQQSHVPETSRKVWSQEGLLSVEEDQVKEHLNTLNIHRSMVPSAERAGWWDSKATLDNLWKVVGIAGGSQGLEESKCYSYLQEGQAGGLQAGKAHLNPMESDWPSNPGIHIQT